MKRNDKLSKSVTNAAIPAVCGNCRHWIRRSDQGKEKEHGACRRFPPGVVVTEEEVVSVSPATSNLFGCGEFALRIDA